MTAIVHGLAKEYDGVAAEILDATTAENKIKIRDEFGFKSHGLVIYTDPAGEPAQKLDGHLLKEPEIRAALEAVLKTSGGDEGGGD